MVQAGRPPPLQAPRNGMAESAILCGLQVGRRNEVRLKLLPSNRDSADAMNVEQAT